MRIRRLSAGIGSIVVIGAMLWGTYVLGRQATKTPVVDPAVASPALIRARDGVLEDTKRQSVSVQWQPERDLVGRLAGTVTAVELRSKSATRVAEGTALYAVDSQPVVMIEGVQPAFRSIDGGVKGADVEQLQRFLGRAGFDPGTIDGTWGTLTVAAWGAWQRAQNMKPTDAIALGQVIFVPGLPRMIAPTDSLLLGGVLTQADKTAVLLQPTPLVFIDTPAATANNLQVGAKVDIKIGGQTVQAVLTDRRTTTESGVRIELDLQPAECGDWCGSIRTGAPTAVPGVIHLAEPVRGTIVPVGALRTGTGSGSAVVLKDGTTQAVRVLVSVGGEAVVEGIQPDAELQLPGAPTSTPTLKK
jgi:peptidoglycan hydrolase-like protein with peptidoglycan-binding domain